MKQKSPTPWLPFSRLLLRPLPYISLATWDLDPLSQHHCIKDMLLMKIYPYLSDRRGINETDVKYVETCNLQKVWDSSDSLNGNSCLLYLIFIPRDLQFQWSAEIFFNTMECDHRGKGKGKGCIIKYWERYSHCQGKSSCNLQENGLTKFVCNSKSIFPIYALS